MASDARKTEWEREIAEQAVRDARAAFAARLAKAERQRDEARAEAARYREALERIATEGEPRKLALQPDAQAFQRIALDALAERARALRGGDGHE